MANKPVNPDNWDSYAQDGEREVVQNKERGCGYLKAENAYIRCDPAAFSTDGVLPGFVAIVDDNGDLHPIPFKESLPRGYESINGTNFLAAAETERNFQPLYPGGPDASESHQEAHESALENHVKAGQYNSIEEVPRSELARHLDRMATDGFDGPHWGKITAANSQDLMMRVGKSYYDSPWDYIDETLELGLNKGISVHSNKSPPVIQPGRTRVWLIHPHACGEDMPGVIGFSYLTRTIFTTDNDGEVPAYAEDYADAGKMDIVDVGEPAPREEDEDREGEDVAEGHQTLDNFDLEEGRKPGHEPGSSSAGSALEDAVEDMAAEVDDVTTRGDVVPPQQIEEMQKAELSELAGQNWLNVDRPPEEYDAIYAWNQGKETGGGLLGIIDNRKVTASNNFSWDSEEQHGTSHVGPYTVEVRERDGQRMILVET